MIQEALLERRRNNSGKGKEDNKDGLISQLTAERNQDSFSLENFQIQCKIAFGVMFLKSKKVEIFSTSSC